MKFGQLLYGTGIVCPPELRDIGVTGLAYDSNRVEKGNVFVCMKGFHTDGHLYAGDAASRGASVVICEEDVVLETVPVLKVSDSRRLLSAMAANFYENGEAPFRLYAVTGTNGKTTVAYMLKSIIEAGDSRCGMIGTIHYDVGGREYEARNTTPESSDLQKLFAEMRDEGIADCVMEVSSHALALGRVDHIRFGHSVFTNLTSDHMDFHQDKEAYFQAKRKLFALTDGTASVNLDDEFGRRLFNELTSENKAVCGYSLRDRKADYFAEILETDERGSVIRVFERQDAGELLKINTPGIFTMYNALAATACARSAGLGFPVIAKGLANLTGVPGRFELIENSRGIIAIVDYAHTPDGLEKVLKTADGFKRGKLICVFGCGGDRDRQKRSLMGAVAGKYSDYCIITSDNPRTEKQDVITADIEAGIYDTGCDYEVIENRYDAIKKAVSIYKKGDIIMIAGKGHESYQIVGKEKIHFDDRETVRNIIENGE